MFGWIGKHWERILLLLLTLLIIGRTIIATNHTKNLESKITDLADSVKLLFTLAPPIPKTLDLDFSNKSGVGRIQGSFTDLLINSQGSDKKGEGYVVHLKTTNPSSIYLSSSNIIFSWKHNDQSKATTVANPNENLLPGASVNQSAYLSPVQGDELKVISVKVDYELMRSR